MKDAGKKPIQVRPAIVVNDNPVQLSILASILEREGLTVFSCHSAAEALSIIAAQGPPSLIVTDLYMPGMDGWRFCRLLRSPEYRELNQTPILVVSATYSSHEAQEVTIQSGADAFLPAPLSVNLLRQQIRALLSGKATPQTASVLIVDADPGEAKQLAGVFETASYQVFHAANGAQGRLLFQTHSPDLVLIDYQLPDLPGDELLREFRRSPLAPIVIMMTQDPTPALATQLLGQGAAAYLQKPFAPEFMVQLCQTAMREQALLSIEVRLEEKTRELRESEARYRSLFKAMGSGFVLFDVIWAPTGKPGDFRFLEVNPAFEDMTGIPRESLIGKTLWELFPSSASAKNELLAEVAMSAKPAHLEFTLSGLNKIFDLAAFSPKPGQLAATFNDITRRKKAEAKIQEQAALLDKAHDAIWVVDLQDHILYHNPSALRLFGWNSNPPNGQLIHDLLPAGAAPKFSEIRATVLQQGQWTGDWVLHFSSVRRLFLHSRWTLVRDERGEPRSLLILNTDLTEQKELEKKYLRAQRIENIGKLAGGIAHDLNNILSPILISLPLLRNRITDETSQNLLTSIENSIVRGAKVIRELLTFGKRLESQRSLVLPDRLVRELAQILTETLPKTIDIEVVMSAGLWPLKGDSNQLHQALLNLCLNAHEAMPRGGKLTLEIQNLRVDENYARLNPEAAPGNYVVITVSDTGVGIPADIQDKIFDPFFTTKPPGKASGLGLSTALGIVKSHGGFIQIFSELGQGSQIKIFLPADETPARETASLKPLPPAKETKPGAGELILLIEDEEAIQQVMKTSLEESGYRVLLAGDGAQAMSLYEKHRNSIAVVVTDMVMPLMNGSQTIRVLRQADAHLPIIAISGMTEDTPEVEASLGLVQAYLSKPFSHFMLLDALQTVLRKNVENGGRQTGHS